MGGFTVITKLLMDHTAESVLIEYDHGDGGLYGLFGDSSELEDVVHAPAGYHPLPTADMVRDLLAILDQSAGGRCEDSTGTLTLDKRQRAVLNAARALVQPVNY